MKKTLFVLITIFTLQPLLSMKPSKDKRPRIGQSDEFGETTVAPYPPAIPIAEELQPTSEALHRAILENNRSLCEWLINNGVDVNTPNQYNNTPLISAVDYHYPEVCKLLLGHGADVNAQNQSGETALAFACEWGHLEICKALIAHGADIHAQSHHRPLLYSPAKHGHSQICRLLLAHGANPNVLDQNGTPTLIACLKSETSTPEKIYQCVKVLLEYGADVNLLSTGRPIDYGPDAQNEGSTALMESIFWGSRELCELLLSYGADYEYENTEHESAIIIAQQGNSYNGNDHALIALLNNPAEIQRIMIRANNPILQRRFGSYSNPCDAFLKRELGEK